MSYKALYRIYRPKDFNEVAGQKHITQTLKNALANDKVAHAYLFSGPRGTGKTSIAKIFAKAINCIHAPTENPCNVCENCKGIQDGTISDVIEIDAASNNGVDEIRELRDKVKYLPGYVKYKVYIIDEVHMLSQGAFNALLKTLEEPPAHVIFILCTTELQKVLPTIQSRCQRFDFKAISPIDITDKLKEIIALENITIEETAIKQIATYAQGGLRDAISLLDQVYSYSPDKISLDDVNQICGAISLTTQLEIAKALIAFDSTKAMSLLDDLLTEGKEVKKIALNLIEFFRDALMYRNLKTIDQSSLLYDNEDFKEIAKGLSNRKAFYIIDLLNQALNEINWSNNPKIHLEMAFMKISSNEDGSNSNLLATIDEIEKRLIELESVKDYLKREDQQEKEIIIKKIVDESRDEEILEEASDIEIPEELPETENTTEGLLVDELIEFKEEVKTKICSNIDNTYSIDFVERVLNNGNRQDKMWLKDRWSSFPDVSGVEESRYLASLLETGIVVASAVDNIIITFSSTTICNTMMMPENKETVKKIMNKKFNRLIDYMALPVNIFEEISQEFINLYRQGKSYVKLSKIVCDGLEDVSIQNEENQKQEVQSRVVQDAISIFGDKVKIKE